MKKTDVLPFIIVLFTFSACKVENCAEGFQTGNKTAVGAGNVSSVRSVTSTNAVSLKVLDWNAQTFFDSVNDGSEYSEFVKSKTWCRDFYVARLNRLCAVLKASDADVIVLEELENEGVMHDISNFMAGQWNSRKLYQYGVFAKDAGSSIGCGVFSRFPLSGMTVHSLDIRSFTESMPSMRPVIEVTVTKNSHELVLLVNHWKSKSGGEEQTEPWRNMQERVLAGIVQTLVEQNRCVLCAGDFNRDVGSFCAGDEPGQVVLRTGGLDGSGNFVCADGVTVSSPWYEQNELVQPGSYFYNDCWERIDNFFACGGACPQDFSVFTEGQWCDEETFEPRKYTLWNGEGYSDHLPIMCTVKF